MKNVQGRVRWTRECAIRGDAEESDQKCPAWMMESTVIGPLRSINASHGRYNSIVTLVVTEVFQSLQGEGPAIGSPATFIRLSGCNLNCSYCDTNHENGENMALTELVDKVNSGPGRVIITGGEPLLAGEKLVPLAQAISTTGRSVDIETNGTISPPAGLAEQIDNYVISPKLSNSGNALDARGLADDLPPGPLKFAVDKEDALDEIKEIVEALPGREVFIMPLGTDPREMISTMILLRPAVEARGWRLLPRLHVLLGFR